jgi:hypothetical protein
MPPNAAFTLAIARANIYELFSLAGELGTHFLVRTCVDRLAGDGNHTIADEMRDFDVAGLHAVEVVNAAGRVETASIEIKYGSTRVLPPIGKQKRYPQPSATCSAWSETQKLLPHFGCPKRRSPVAGD